jgi:hypothetical protein
VGAIALLNIGVNLAQSGNMMNGGTGGGSWMGGGGWIGGYGGVWMPIFFVVVVIGLVAWIVSQGGK